MHIFIKFYLWEYFIFILKQFQDKLNELKQDINKKESELNELKIVNQKLELEVIIFQFY